jgi:signal transduction histidine kinase
MASINLQLTDSLLGALTLRLVLVLAIVMGVVLWQIDKTLNRTGDMAQDELLRRQASEIINSLSVSGGKRGGKLKVNLAAETEAAYANRDEGNVYYIQDAEGRMLAQSDPMASIWVQPALALRPVEPVVIDTQARDGVSSALYLLVQPVSIPGGPLYVIVGQYRTIDDMLLQSAKKALMPNLLMVLLPLFGGALVGMIALMRQGLRPLDGLARTMSETGHRVQQGHEGRVDALNLPGEVRPVANAFNDVLDEFRKNLAAQKALTADTAHQLKTPIAVIQARLEQLPPFEGKQALTADVYRMNRLVRQLLHYAVLAQHPSVPVAGDLTNTVKDVVMSMVPLARKAKVDLRFAAPEEPVLVMQDAIQVTEAISNLIDNAIRHSPDEKGIVEVEVTEDGTVEVRDRGPGIPEHAQAMVFTRFWQGPDTPDASTHGGAGLGLAVVAEIMRQHGGHAHVETRPGGGATFILEFRKA